MKLVNKETKLAIWKYGLSVTGVQTIVVPGKVRPLCVDIQNNQPCIWIEVEPDGEKHELEIVIHGTGHEYGASERDTHQYFGTVQQAGGALIWHIFIKKSDNWQLAL